MTNLAGPPHPPPPKLALGILKNVNPFFILMDSIHFKTDFYMKKKIVLFTSFIPLLFTVSKLYYTYHHFMLLMMVCIVLIWFLLTVLQESSNLDTIFIVCRRKKEEKNFELVFAPTPPPPPPPFWSKANFLNFICFNPSLRLGWQQTWNHKAIVQIDLINRNGSIYFFNVL